MGIFRFKQFQVDQTGCAMKVNTDGVLLGALAGSKSPKRILDIGTGTGVVALMLAQRFPDALIDAVEIDTIAAATAKRNFEDSPFADRLTVYSTSFQDFFADHTHQRYDLIVSNPPFYINSLASPHRAKTVAKHAGEDFFDELIGSIPQRLNDDGRLVMILPVDTAQVVISMATQHGLHLHSYVDVSSYPDDSAHRKILSWSRSEVEEVQSAGLVIYIEPRKYTAPYSTLLSDFLTIF